MKNIRNLVALSFVFANSLTAQTSYDFKRLQEQHKLEIERTVLPINKRYEFALKQLLDRATQAKDLATAVKIQQAIDSISSSASSIKYISSKSAPLEAAGFSKSKLPVMQATNAEDVFKNIPVYFNMESAKSVVFSVRSAKPISSITYRGVAFINFTLEARDESGSLLGQSDTVNIGNVENTIVCTMPPSTSFTITIANQAKNWMLIKSIELK